MALRNYLTDDVGFSVTDPYHAPGELISYDSRYVVYTKDDAPDPRYLMLYRDSFADQLSPYLTGWFARTVMYSRAEDVFNNSTQADLIKAEKPGVFVYEISERYLDVLPNFRLPHLK